GYLFVAVVDTMHTLAYKCMGVFPGGGADLPTQLWIAGRYLQAATLVVAPFAIGRAARPHLWVTAFALVTGGLLAVVFLGGFPHCYVEGVGLTEFKKASEYAVAALFVVSIGLLVRRRTAFDPLVLALLVGSLVFAIATELAFTEYGSVYGNANLAGHLLKIVAFYLVYKAIIETGLRQPYRLLFRELATRERALETRGAELAAVNAELETFAYSASHDLRAPLRAIDGYARALAEDCGDALDERGTEYLARIDAAAKRMDQLIDDLLRLSRLMLGEVRRRAVDLAEVARSVEAELAEQEPGRRVEFVCPPTAPVDGDPGLLRVLLENLIGNAWKFTSTHPTARIEFGVDRR
ncbi:MAG: hybrid sensor histidine kinase/response regulator, partial [Acidobacteriota bacterium]|nr:hybrid sensor histidine kinase/response regulator [Acidobacteriota bacterium]